MENYKSSQESERYGTVTELVITENMLGKNKKLDAPIFSYPKRIRIPHLGEIVAFQGYG